MTMDKYSVKVILKAMEILKCFSPKKPEWTVNELGDRLNMNRTTVYRILTTLAAGGFVQANPNSGSYCLGSAIIGLSMSLYSNIDLKSAARHVLKDLAQKTKESVQLTIWHNDRVALIEQWESPFQIKVSVPIGTHFPAYCTATGKIFLASLPEKELNNYFSKVRLKHYTDKTNTCIDILKKELLKVAENQIAFDNEEYVNEMIGCAVPVYSYDHKTVASIAVLGPNHRMRAVIDEIVLLVQETGKQISANLGFIPNPD